MKILITTFLALVMCGINYAAQQTKIKMEYVVIEHVDAVNLFYPQENIADECAHNFEVMQEWYCYALNEKKDQEAHFLICLRTLEIISEYNLSEELGGKISAMLIDIISKIRKPSIFLSAYKMTLENIAKTAKNIEISLRAEYCLGYINYHSKSKADFGAAVDFFKPLTEQSIDLYAKREACRRLAFIFADGGPGVEKDEIMAIYYTNITLLYFGERVPKDIVDLALELQATPMPTRRASLDLSSKFIETRRASI